MASTDVAASVLTGPATPGLTLAGAGGSPFLGRPFSESANPTSTLGNTDASDVASVTVVRPAQVPLYSITTPGDSTDLGVTQLPTTNTAALSAAAGSVLYYKMRGMDHNTAGLYDTWVVLGLPDYAASTYTGALALPLRDVIISAAWSL